MKKIILFAGIIFLAACGSDSTVNDNKEQSAEIVATVLPNIEGVWVMTDYISKMETERSPKAASELLDGIVGIVINKSSVRVDSMEGGANWNNHEGTGFTIYFKKGIAENSLKTSLADEKGFSEIGYADSSLVLYNYNKASKLINKRIYKKVLRKQLNSDLSFGIQYIVNKKILEGKYTGVDSAKNKSDVEFAVDGKVKGLANYNYFTAATDFMDAYSNMDYIIFYKDEETNEAFGYTSKNDSLCLYTLNKNEENGTIFYGKLRYALTKKN